MSYDLNESAAIIGEHASPLYTENSGNQQRNESDDNNAASHAHGQSWNLRNSQRLCHNFRNIHALTYLAIAFMCSMILMLIGDNFLTKFTYPTTAQNNKSDNPRLEFVNTMDMTEYLPVLHAKNKAQKLANQQVQQGLNEPTLRSEMYHDTQNFKPNLSPDEHNKSSTKKKKKKKKKMYKNIELSQPVTVPSPPPENGCEATILIVRHCEKTDVREHCAYIGYERAVYLSTLFGNSDDVRWPLPSYLFALSPGERNNKRVSNWREVETLIPLRDKVNVTIDSSYGLEETDDLISHLFGLLRSGEMCGKLSVICWKHDVVPHLAQQLGCGPENGCPTNWQHDDFDSAWQIKYSYHKLMHSPYVAKAHISRKQKEKQLKTWAAYPMWWVYGSKQNQNFDPLEFSKKMGDYPEGGRSYGGSWLHMGDETLKESSAP